MKKVIYLILASFFLLSSLTKAQSNKSTSSNAKCFDENSHILNIGIGFGPRYYSYGRGGGYTYRSTPAISLSYEQAIKEKLGPGYLGVGAYFGYQRASFTYDDYFYNNTKYYYKHSWNYTLIAARAAYHLDILNIENAELYFGAILGLRFQSYKYETNSIDPNRDLYQLNNRAVYPSYSLFVGGRWYFKPKIALFGELGYGISYITGGLSFKF
jgi:hypothetical protein